LVVQKEMTKHGIHPLRSVQGTIEMGEEKRMRGREGRKEGRKRGRGDSGAYTLQKAWHGRVMITSSGGDYFVAIFPDQERGLC
jgi:hypothetical protein